MPGWCGGAGIAAIRCCTALSLRPPRGTWSTSEEARKHTWDLLAQYAANTEEPLSITALNSRLGVRGAFAKDFRVDAFGNVVCLGADSRAVTGFQVDHIFPNSRGGLSANDNGIALYWGANQGVKSDHLVNILSAAEMQCGLRAEDLLALVDAIAHESVSKDERRRRAEELEAMLTVCLPTGKGSVEDFQRLVDKEHPPSSTACCTVTNSSANSRRLQGLNRALACLRDSRLIEQARVEQICKDTQKASASATHVRCLADGECERCALPPGGRLWEIRSASSTKKRVYVTKRAPKGGHCNCQVIQHEG